MDLNMGEHEPDDAVSDGLAVAIESVIEAEELDVPVTLASVRRVLKHARASRSMSLRRLGAEERVALLLELDELIRSHGSVAAAERFTPAFAASEIEPLLEHVVGDGESPTLGEVRSRIEQGLLAELVGAGEIAEEGEQAIRERLDVLIERHGHHAFAEDFIGRG